MLRATDIDWAELENLEGWISDYLAVVKGTRFPPAFHLLAGLYSLSSIIGRRGLLIRPGYTLYPPLWIFLLGSSGTGKSSALRAAHHVMLGAKVHKPDLFVDKLGNFTASSLLRCLNEDQNGHPIVRTKYEGGIIVEEAASLFSGIVGNDSNASFLLVASAFESPEYWTNSSGKRNLTNYTLGKAFASTISSLVQAKMSGDSFGDGLMHRFLIVHGVEKPRSDSAFEGEKDIDQDKLLSLGRWAYEIGEGTPPVTKISDAAHQRLQAIAKQKENIGVSNMNLTGFVNRISGIVARVGLILARSRGSVDLELRDVEQALPLVERISEPLYDLVVDLDMAPKKRHLITKAYNVWHSLHKGVTVDSFRRTLPGITDKKLNEEYDFLKRNNYVFEGSINGEKRVWGDLSWVKNI